LEFKTTEYGREKMIVPAPEIAEGIKNNIGIRKTMRLTGMSQHTIEKLVDLREVKRTTYEHVVKTITAYKSTAVEIGITPKA
jgi:hypothetical protein